MVLLWMVLIQGLPEVDFNIFGAFGISLTLLLIACGYLIKQVKYYREQLKDLRKEKNEIIEKLRTDKNDLQKQRQAETHATIEALKEINQILKKQVEAAK